MPDLIYSISGNVNEPCVINIVQGPTFVGTTSVSGGDYIAVFETDLGNTPVIAYTTVDDETKCLSKIVPLASVDEINVVASGINTYTPQVPLGISGIISGSDSCTISIVEGNQIVSQEQAVSGRYSILYNGFANDTLVDVIAESPDIDKNGIVYRRVKPLLFCPSTTYQLIVENKADIDIFNLMIRDETKGIFQGNTDNLFLTSYPTIDISDFVVRDESRGIFYGDLETLVLMKPPDIDVMVFMIRDEIQSIFVGNSSSLILQEDREILSCIALTT